MFFHGKEIDHLSFSFSSNFRFYLTKIASLNGPNLNGLHTECSASQRTTKNKTCNQTRSVELLFLGGWGRVEGVIQNRGIQNLSNGSGDGNNNATKQ